MTELTKLENLDFQILLNLATNVFAVISGIIGLLNVLWKLMRKLFPVRYPKLRQPEPQSPIASTPPDQVARLYSGYADGIGFGLTFSVPTVFIWLEGSSAVSNLDYPYLLLNVITQCILFSFAAYFAVRRNGLFYSGILANALIALVGTAVTMYQLFFTDLNQISPSLPTSLSIGGLFLISGMIIGFVSIKLGHQAHSDRLFPDRSIRT